MIDCAHSENPAGAPAGEKVGEALLKAVERLRAAAIGDPSREARLLMRWATGLTGAGLAAEPERPLGAEEAARFGAAVAARAARRPLAQIVGGREFYGRWFQVTEAVLDPRPESETLVEQALACAPANTPFRALDLGVGSGALLLSVLAERPQASGLGVDSSADALAVAAANAAALGLADRAEFRRGDWLDGVSERFDAILCNPPYVAAAELERLEPEVRLYEPRRALSPGPDGLAAFRRVAASIGDALTVGGAAHFEVGVGQADAVAALLEAAGLRTERRLDLDGRERVVSAFGRGARAR